MNKNYYDILEININASPEIIEKAYKTLAKKYHPDLQQEENKKQSEEIFKIINEAYEVLSNPEKKSMYDQNLKNTYDDIQKQNEILKNKLNNIQSDNTPNQNVNTVSTNNNHISQEDLIRQQQAQLDYEKQVQAAREKAYHDAYVQNLKNRGYKIRYKKTLKDYLHNLIALLILISIIIILWQIPVVKNLFTNMYEKNFAIRYIIDSISNLFK